jgi:hypothetical protein
MPCEKVNQRLVKASKFCVKVSRPCKKVNQKCVKARMPRVKVN